MLTDQKSARQILVRRLKNTDTEILRVLAM